MSCQCHIWGLWRRGSCLFSFVPFIILGLRDLIFSLPSSSSIKKKKKLFNTAITPQLCYGLFTTLWHYINAVIHTKGAPYKVIFVVIVIVSSMCCVPSRHSTTVPNGFQLGFLGPRLTYQELAARNKCCINKMHIKSAHTPNIIFSWELPPAFISSRQQ